MSRSLLVLAVVCVSTSLLAANEAVLSLTVKSGSTPETYVKASQCTVRVSGTSAIAKKIQRANAGKKGYLTPGAIIPDIEYTAAIEGTKVVLSSDTDRGSALNYSAEAGELRDAIYKLCVDEQN